jgi:prepilin peptidase CpaA
MSFVTAVIVVIGCAAALDDLRRRQVSNWITVPAAAAGLGAWSILAGFSGLLFSIEGLLVGFGSFLLLYIFGGMGGGDLKLMAGFGALLGPSSTLVAVCLSLTAGGIWAAGMLGYGIVRRLASGPSTRIPRTMPYAPAIVLGTWAAFLVRS